MKEAVFMFNKILVPVDGSPFSNAAIEKAREIAEAFGSEIILLNAVEASSIDYPSYPYKFSPELIRNFKKEYQEISVKILEDARKKLADFGKKVKTESIEGPASEVIVQYAEDNPIDLVIMGSNGMSGMRNIMGSVTRKVVLNIKKPILIISDPTE